MTDANGQAPRARVRLDTFSVEGFRSLRDTDLCFEPDVTVLVGRNDVGKSSLLDALARYGEIVRNGFRTVVRDREYAEEGPPARFTALWTDLDTEESYEHCVDCDPKTPVETLGWRDEKWTWRVRERELRGGQHKYDARGIPRYRSIGSIEEADWRTETEVPDEVGEHLGVVRRFCTPTPFLFEPSMLALDVPLTVTGVERNGAGFVLKLQDIINRRDESLSELEERTKDLFPFFQRVTVVEERFEVTRMTTGVEDALRGPASREDTRKPGGFLQQMAESESQRSLRFEVECTNEQLIRDCRWVPATSMSSGLLLALAYLTIVTSEPEGSLLALEEPENGLNAAVVEKMIDTFLQLVADRQHQLVMTTHNPYWLDRVAPRCIRVVTRDQAGTHVHADEENLKAILDEGFYLSEVMGLSGPEKLLKRRGGADE